MKDFRTATLAFAHFLGLPKAMPAVASKAKRLAASRPVEAAARAAKAALPKRTAQTVSMVAQIPAAPVPQVVAVAKRTTVRDVRGEERARCEQIMNAAMKAGNPRIGLEFLNTNMKAADAVSLIQLLNLDTASLCERWSKGQVIGVNE